MNDCGSTYPASCPTLLGMSVSVELGFCAADRREMLLATFDDQMAVLDAGVFQARLGVVLAFVVADEAFFVAPFGRIGQPLIVELVRPDELPVGSRNATGHYGEHDDCEQAISHKIIPTMERQ